MPKFEFQPGATPIADYTIQYALGRGGFGEVYFATSPAGREIALKAILNHEEIEIRGVQNCMNLDSPRLVTIFDVRRDADGIPWVMMEYVRGPSLNDIINESPGGLGPEKALYLLRELSLALTDLHNAGVVHRDLKPSNVFFDKGRVKIGDYSLSKTIASNLQSQHTMTVGSVHYMAPEISLGRYDKSVDIYALGVIFYEMLSGIPPHTGQSVGEILMKHLHGTPDVDTIDARFRSVILCAMNRDPSLRFQSAEDFAKAALRNGDLRNLVDSFNPATLSMIGERHRLASSNQIVLDDTITANSPDLETNVQRRPTEVDESTSIPIRFLIAFVAISLLILVSEIWDNRAGVGLADGFALSFAILLAGVVPASTKRNSEWSTVRKISFDPPDILAQFGIALASVVVFLLASWFGTSIEIEGLLVASCGCFLTMMIVDWGSLASRRRPRPMAWSTVATAIVVPAALAYVAKFEAWILFSAVTTIAILVAVSVLSPRRIRRDHTIASVDAASAVPPPTPSRQPPAFRYEPRQATPPTTAPTTVQHGA